MPEPKRFFSITPLAVSGYMLCSATLFVSNKYAVYKVAAPSFILFSQLMGTALAFKLLSFKRKIKCDALERKRVKSVKQFVPAAFIFFVTIFSNMDLLQYADIEAFMVFRFSTPLVMRIADHLLLKQKPPSPRSWSCLFALLVGALGYVYMDLEFEVNGYTSCAVWYCILSLDQVYLKHISNTDKMRSNWRRVYYSLFSSNLLASLPLLFKLFSDNDEITALKNITADAALIVFVSVALGVGVSYFAWMTMSLLSAERFTVVGNTCKIITIVINFFIATNVLSWDTQATFFRLGCLVFSLGVAYFYKQATMLADSEGSDEKPLLPK